MQIYINCKVYTGLYTLLFYVLLLNINIHNLFILFTYIILPSISSHLYIIYRQRERESMTLLQVLCCILLFFYHPFIYIQCNDIDIFFVIFDFQEPLTGLDASTAYSFIQMLKTYAASHDKIVITTVHQPSSKLFFSFDSLLLMCEGQV